MKDKALTRQGSGKSISYRDAVNGGTEERWQALAGRTVADAVRAFLESLDNDHTRRAYKAGLEQLAERGLLDPLASLQDFALRGHNSTLDKIKRVQEWAEDTRQARAACYLSFTGFLSRRSEGLIRKAQPSHEGVSKTFYKTRDIVSTPAMDRKQWGRFLDKLDQINHRDGLIARILLQGGKRLGEVLPLETGAIDWELRQITFRQSKTKGREQETIITYPPGFMDALSEYIDERTGPVFITRNGKAVQPTQVVRSFKTAGEKAKIGFAVTPHVLRASTVTYLKREGYSDSDIAKITGHASLATVKSYDRSGISENISREIALV